MPSKSSRRFCLLFIFVLIVFALSCSYNSFNARMEFVHDNFYGILANEKLDTLSITLEVPLLFLLDDKTVESIFDEMLVSMVASYERKSFSRNDHAGYLILSGAVLKDDTTDVGGAFTTLRDSIMTHDEFEVGNLGLEQGQNIYLSFRIKHGEFLECDPGYVSEDGKQATLIFVGPNEAEKIHLKYKLPTAWWKVWSIEGRAELGEKLSKSLDWLRDFFADAVFAIGVWLRFSPEPYLGYPVLNKDAAKGLKWEVPDNSFGNYLDEFKGYHGGQDWRLVGVADSDSLPKPVYAIAPGVVRKISDLGDLGFLVAVEHPAPAGHHFKIPAQDFSFNGKNFSYHEETVALFYSLSFHITPDSRIKEGVTVAKYDTLGYITAAGSDPYLYFEIRHPKAVHSKSWWLVGSSSNWSRFPENRSQFNGYYNNPQAMISAGLREPHSFIKANARLIKPTQPDLVVTSVDPPKETKAGEKIKIGVEIKNQGAKAEGADPLQFRLVLSSDFASFVIADTLFEQKRFKTGFVFNGNIEARIPMDFAEGNYTVSAQIDAASTCQEFDEKNNILYAEGATHIKEYEMWTFAHITDVHIGCLEDVKLVPKESSFLLYGKRFSDALQHIAIQNPKPEFILITGDLVEWADSVLFSQFKAYLSTFQKEYRIPIYVVPGNHDRYKPIISQIKLPLLQWSYEFVNNLSGEDDIGYAPYDNDNLEMFYKIMNAPTFWKSSKAEISILPGFELYDGPISDSDQGLDWYNYSFEYKGFLFIGLDSGADKHNDRQFDVLPQGRGLHKFQKTALEMLCKENKEPKVIFMHHPICEQSIDNDNGSLSQNRHWFIDTLCTKQNVKLVLTGHTHEDLLISPQKTIFVQTPSVVKDHKIFKHGYRLTKVYSDKIVPQLYTKTPDMGANILLVYGNAYSSVQNSQNQKTGYGSIITDIPNSFYTGYYGPDTPQAITLYDTDDAYTYELHGTGNDTAQVSLFSKGLHIHLPKLPVKKSTLDEMHLTDDTTFVFNTSDEEKYFSLSFNKTVGNERRSFIVSNTTISKSDSSHFKIINNDAIQYTNTGTPKSYNLELVSRGAETTRIAYSNLTMNANETHTLKPTTWSDLAESNFVIEIDKENNATIDTVATIKPAISKYRILDKAQAHFNLWAEYTLPISTQAQIKYSIPRPCRVILKIYDKSGRRIQTFVENTLAPGVYAQTWHAKNELDSELSPGVYIVRMTINDGQIDETITKKIMVLNQF